MKDEKLRILIIEDDRDLNNLLKYTLEASRDYEVKSHFDGNGADELISQFMPDLVLLDVMLPNRYGTEILKNVRDNPLTSGILVILLTARSQEKDKVEGFEAGADDYITKPFSMVLLGRRVTALLRRSGKCAISNIMAFGDVQVNFSGYTASDQNGKIDITPKELDLLKLLVEHKGLVLTRSQIMDELWGYDCSIIDRTIDTYIKNLRKKLRLNCIVTVKGIGYKYEVAV